MPRLPQKKQPAADVPTLPLALLLALVCGGGFFGLLSLVFPGAGMLGVTLAVLGLFFVAQYYVWGRWLYRWAIAKEARAEASREPPQSSASSP